MTTSEYRLLYVFFLPFSFWDNSSTCCGCGRLTRRYYDVEIIKVGIRIIIIGSKLDGILVQYVLV